MNQKYIDMVYSENHLEHHGVLGQKWGVENGPPYPLGRDVQSMLSNGASYHSIKKAIRSDYKAEKKELKNTVVNEEKRYMNTLNDERRKNEDALNKLLNDDPRRIAEDYQYNKQINGRIARDLMKNQLIDLQSRKEAEEDRYASAIDNATKRKDEAWAKYADSKKAAKENYKSEMKELEDATGKGRLNKALKIAGVAAGVAAVAGVSYLAATAVSKKLDENDRADKGITRADLARKLSDGQFKNDVDIVEKSIKDRASEMSRAGTADQKYKEVLDNATKSLVTGEYEQYFPKISEAQNKFRAADRSVTRAAEKVIDNKQILKGNANTPSRKIAASLVDKYDRNRYLNDVINAKNYAEYSGHYDKMIDMYPRSKKLKL